MIFIKLTQEILQFGKLKLIEEKNLHVLMICVRRLCSAFISGQNAYKDGAWKSLFISCLYVCKNLYYLIMISTRFRLLCMKK